MKKFLFFLKITIVEVIIIAMDFLFSWLGIKDLSALDIFKWTFYFEIPSLIVYFLSFLSGFIMNEKRLAKFKKKRKKINVLIIIFSLLLCLILDFIYVFTTNTATRFSLPFLGCAIFIYLLDYPWLEPKKEKDEIDILIEKSRNSNSNMASTDHQEKID